MSMPRHRSVTGPFYAASHREFRLASPGHKNAALQLKTSNQGDRI